MSGVKLMNRVDSKFLTTLPVLADLLVKASPDFFIQDSNGLRNMRYYTRYFDTDDTQMYVDHQWGKKSRRKIRIRQYLDSNLLPFLEIKDKNNKGRTKKNRVSMALGEEIDEYADFISKNSDFFVGQLSPKIENRFRRITLVNKEKSERITIDTSIEFHNFVSGLDVSLPELVIIEWKRDVRSCSSRLKPLLREFRIPESGFSKYCVGMAMTDFNLRRNRVKKRLRKIDKIMG